MQSNSRVMIGTMEAVSILTVSRVFTAVTFPAQNSSINITSSMIAFVFGFVIDLIIILPFLWLIKKHSTHSVVEFAYEINDIFGKSISLIFAFVFTLLCAMNLSSFTRFVSKEFLNTNAFPILFLITLAVVYCAFMGIEALGRFSNIVLLILILSVFTVFFLFLNDYKLNNFYSPLEDNILSTVSEGFFKASNTFEVASVLFLAPVVKGRKKRGFVCFLLISLLLIETIIFSIGAVFGDYANITTYTYYNLIQVSGISSLRRIDSVYVAVWVLLGFVKSGYYLILAENLFSSFFKKPNKTHSLTIVGTTTFLIAGALLLKPEISMSLHLPLKVFLILCIVVIPTVILILLKRRKRLET